MIPNHPYVAMLVTGCLHLVLGVGCIINAILGMTVGSCIIGYSAGALIVGIWILVVGGLGIATGAQMNEDVTIRKSILLNGGYGLSAECERLAAEKIRRIKSVYMVTAIMSACMFSVAGLGFFVTALFAAEVKRCKIYECKYFAIGSVGITLTILECILAIISSTVCYCCSSTNTTTIVQAPMKKIVTTVPDQSSIKYHVLSSTTREYLQPLNTRQNQTPGYGAMLSNPLAYQQCGDLKNPQQ